MSRNRIAATSDDDDEMEVETGAAIELCRRTVLWCLVKVNGSGSDDHDDDVDDEDLGLAA
jgi:hypothetical protein